MRRSFSTNNWKKIWENKEYNPQMLSQEFPDKILSLKNVDGFDSMGTLNYNAFLHRHQKTIIELTRSLSFTDSNKHIFEIGCGSGPNLLFFQKDGLEVGGIDYSPSLISIAQKYFN